MIETDAAEVEGGRMELGAGAVQTWRSAPQPGILIGYPTLNLSQTSRSGQAGSSPSPGRPLNACSE